MKSIEKELIDLLTRIECATDFPLEFQADASPTDIRLAADLIDRGYLDGGHAEDERGVPCAAAVTGITLSGREYLQEVKDKHFKKSASGKFVRVLKYLGVFVLGIIGTLLTQWIGKKMGLK